MAVAFLDIFAGRKPIIAMLHLKAGNSGAALALAKEEIDIFEGNNIDAVLVENYFGSIEDCQDVLGYLQHRYKRKRRMAYGVSIVGDYRKAFELASKYDAQFIKIDSVCGHLHGEADKEYGTDLKKLRANCSAAVLGGVRFKYQPVCSGRSLEEDLRIGMERCDGIVVTGGGTGEETPEEKLQEFRSIVGNFPLITGAGVTPANIDMALKHTDGMIIGSWLKEGHSAHGDVSAENIRRLKARISELRDIESRQALKKQCLSLKRDISSAYIHEMCDALLFGTPENRRDYIRKYKTYDPFTRAQLGYVFAYILAANDGYRSSIHTMGHFSKGDIDIPFAFIGWSGEADGFSGISFAVNPLCFTSGKPRLIYCDDYLTGDSDAFLIITKHICEYASGIADVRLVELDEASLPAKFVRQRKKNHHAAIYGIAFTLDSSCVKDSVYVGYKWQSTKDVGEYVIPLARCGEFDCYLGELGMARTDGVVLLAADSFCMK